MNFAGVDQLYFVNKAIFSTSPYVNIISYMNFGVNLWFWFCVLVGRVNRKGGNGATGNGDVSTLVLKWLVNL